MICDSKSSRYVMGNLYESHKKGTHLRFLSRSIKLFQVYNEKSENQTNNELLSQRIHAFYGVSKIRLLFMD